MDLTITRLEVVSGTWASPRLSSTTKGTAGSHLSVSSRRTMGSATAAMPSITGKIRKAPMLLVRRSMARSASGSSCERESTGNITDCTAASRFRLTVLEKVCPRL